MFNFNRVAELERKNADLQKQYDTVFGLLQERQDDMLRLQRELAETKAKPDYSEVIGKAETCIKSQVDFRLASFLKEGLCVGFVDHFMSSFKFNLDPTTYGTPVTSDSDSDSDEDEDEDEDYD